MPRPVLLLALAGGLAVAGCGGSAADFRAGMRAFAEGSYGDARSRLRPLASLGHAAAQFQLGLMFAEGLGGEPDARSAAGWYQRAAQQGHASAQYYLSRMYADGRGVPRDPRKAFLWMERLARQGFAPAAHELGRMHRLGLGTKADPEEARRWTERATRAGYSPSGAGGAPSTSGFRSSS